MAGQDSAAYSNETEINLRDVFWFILKKWVWLLAGMIVCAVLLGGYKAYSTSRQLAAQNKNTSSQSETTDTPESKTDGDPAIIYQPVDVTAEAGERVSFAIATSGKVTKYLWQYSKDGMAWTNLSTSTYPSAATNKLSLVCLATQSGYVWRCNVTFDGDVVKASEPAYLTVSAAGSASKTTLKQSDIIKSGIKYGVVGLILGIVAAAACLAVVFVSKGYIANKMTIQSRYGKPSFGVYPSKSNTGLARKIMNKLTYQNDLSQEEALKLIAANLNLSAGNAKKVLLVGTVPSRSLDNLAKALAPYVKGELVAAGNINNQADAVNALSEGPAVVCVEQVLGSRLTNVDFEMGTLARSSSDCLGFILTE